MDQDTLNVVFEDKVKYLSFSYNMTLTNWRNKTSEELSTYYELPYESEKNNYLRKADIIHFASSDKPWVYYDTHFADVWLTYFLLSPFRTAKDFKRISLHTIINSSEIAKVRIQPASAYEDNHKLCKQHNTPNSPLISVIVPVYNSEAYLGEALSSVFCQSLSDIEVICIDDGSTDGSDKILDEWEKRESRLTVLCQENQYAGVARNKGISQSKGEYIAFLDSDDVLSRNALEAYYCSAISSSADVVVSSTCIFEQSLDNRRPTTNWVNEDYTPRKDVFAAKDFYPFIFNFTVGGPDGKCFRKAFIDQNKLQFLSLPKSEDFYFVHTGIAKANVISILRDPVYNIRIVTTSLEHRKNDLPLVFWDAIVLMKQHLIDENLYEATEQSFVNENINRFSYNLRSMKTSDGYTSVFDQLQKIFDSELKLATQPKKYYYNTLNYEYLCGLLSIN